MRKRERKKWKRWQKITVAIAFIALFAGLGLLLFPTVSNFFGQQRANAVIEEFRTKTEHIIPERDEPGEDPDPVTALVTAHSYSEALEKGEIDEEGYTIDESGSRTSSTPVVFRYDLDALYRDSVAYNEGLIRHQGTVDTSDYSAAALNMRSYGLSNQYCYLSAPSIDLYLPVYLGANDTMMSCGAAHLNGTSLPIDKKDTNVAIAGHTDYIGRIFFDNIRRLGIGETVTVNNYWESIDYRVIEHKIVTEDVTEDIYIKEGRQLLTLITCVYSGKSDVFDRYLVICEKV